MSNCKDCIHFVACNDKTCVHFKRTTDSAEEIFAEIDAAYDGRKQQIWEIANVIFDADTIASLCWKSDAIKIAEALYDADYRKSVEVVENIFAEIEKCFGHSTVLPQNVGLVDLDKLAELKKKHKVE